MDNTEQDNIGVTQGGQPDTQPNPPSNAFDVIVVGKAS